MTPRDVRAELDVWLECAADASATTLTLLAGHPPQMRVEGRLEPLRETAPLHHDDTEHLAREFLHGPESAKFEETGQVEVPFRAAGREGLLTVFYGNGCHNLVFHLAG